MPENPSLGAFIQLIKGRVPKGVDASNSQLLPYLTPEYLRGGSNIPELFPTTDKTVQVEDGEIIILCDGSNAGEIFSAREGIVSSTMAVIKFDQRAIQRDFLFHYPKFYEPYLKAQTAGSGIPHLDKELLGLLPAISQTEAAQTHIAAILTNLSQLITATEAQLAKQHRLRTGILHDLLTRGLDNQGQLRSEETHEFKDSPLGRIPIEWEAKTVGEVFDMVLGKMLNKEAKVGPNQYLYLGNRNVLWNQVDLSNLQTMSFSKSEREKLRLVNGDILVCEGGAPGRTAIWRDEIPECYLQKAIHLLRPKQNNILPEFTLAFFADAHRKGLMFKLMSQTSIAHLTQDKLALLEFPVIDVSEQEQIKSAIQAQDMYQQKTAARLTKLRRLKTGLMQDLLTGHFPVGNLDTILSEA